MGQYATWTRDYGIRVNIYTPVDNTTTIIIGPPADRMRELPPCVDDIKQKVCERMR